MRINTRNTCSAILDCYAQAGEVRDRVLATSARRLPEPLASLWHSGGAVGRAELGRESTADREYVRQPAQAASIH